MMVWTVCIGVFLIDLFAIKDNSDTPAAWAFLIFILSGILFAIYTAVRKTPVAPEPADRLDALKKLGELRDSGVITQEEFERKKTELL